MTTIVYTKGRLAVDRKVQIQLGTESYYTDADKFFKIDNKIVGAITGVIPVDEKRKAINDGLIAISTNYESGKESNKEILDSLNELLTGATCIWMTKRYVYLLECGELYPYDRTVSFARGAGMYTAEALLSNNVLIEEIYPKISRIDPLTGSAFNVFRMSDLRVLEKIK